MKTHTDSLKTHRPRFLAASLLLAAAGLAHAVPIAVTDRTTFGASDYVDWSTVGTEFDSLGSSFTATSNGGIGIEVSGSTGPAGFERADNNSSWAGNFAPADALLWTGFDSVAQMMTIDFLTPVFGAGAQIQNDFLFAGAFQATLSAYDSIGGLLFMDVFNGFSDSANDDSAIFLGVSNDVANISKLELTVADQNGPSGSFAINRLALNAPKTQGVPEGGSGLLAIMIVSLGLAHRFFKSSKKGSRPAVCAAAAAAALGLAAPPVQAALDNKGTDFIMAFNQNYDNDVTIELHLTSDVATQVTVNYPVNLPTFTTTVPVSPGNVTIVTLPASSATSWATNTVLNNGVRAFSNNEFVCYMINRRPFTSDAALALPIDTMNTEYIVSTYSGAFDGSQFAVIAGFDNTTVTITPNNTIDGHPAGVPFNIALNRGQGYYGKSTSGDGLASSLTGTIITADRPVGVTSGNSCTQVPNGTAFCDHVFEVNQPVQSWGVRSLVANLPNRTGGSIYRIVASQDNTTVRRNGAVIGVINRAQFIETAALPGNHVFEADRPIFVTQFMTGSSSPGATIGDPSMGNMIPVEQYLKQYTFSTVGEGQFVQDYVTIIAANSDIGAVLLDGAPVAPGSFSAIPGTTFSAAVVALTSGTHNTSSPNPHGITVEGYNADDSYLYPGGALFQFINPSGDANPPVLGPLAYNPGPPPSACGTATDQRPTEDTNGNLILDPGEDLNGNGQIDKDTGAFFVQLAPGSVNLSLVVSPFTPGDPQVNYCVYLIDPTQSGNGIVVVTDGAGNESRIPVALQVNNNLPPTTSSTSKLIASGLICTVFAQDDQDPAPRIYIKDSASAFVAGPYTSGAVLSIRKNPKMAPFSRPLTAPYTAYIQLKGNPLMYAVDSQGAASVPVPCN